MILTQQLVDGATTVFFLANARAASTQRRGWKTWLGAISIDRPALIMAQLEALAWFWHAWDAPNPQVEANIPSIERFG